MPPITRAYTTACVLTTAAVVRKGLNYLIALWDVPSDPICQLNVGKDIGNFGLQ